jgi:fructose 1,6-bisphosphatase
MKYLLFLLLLLTSCASHKVIHQEDVTAKAGWLESTKDNPIINVIQKHYANDDVEIIIKKKLTTDYVKVRLSRKGKVISKKTIKH